MPVDPFGKLVPNRYATPINRKPRKRRRSWIVNGCLALVALALIFVFVVGVYSCSMRQRGQVNVRTDWPAILTASATGSEYTAPITVTSVWQITWQCNAPLVVQGVSSNGLSAEFINTDCDISQESGAVQVTGAGTVSLRIISQGPWTVSIREPQ